MTILHYYIGSGRENRRFRTNDRPTDKRARFRIPIQGIVCAAEFAMMTMIIIIIVIIITGKRAKPTTVYSLSVSFDGICPIINYYNLYI